MVAGEPVPGTVFIVPLADTEDYTQIIQNVYDACSAETVRPLNDNVIVSAPTEVEYQIEVEITAFTGTDLTALQSAVYTALQDYAKSKENRLGLDIVRSHITQVCRLPQVYDVRVVEPSWGDGNIIIENDEVPVCSEITVEIIGTNNG